MSTKYYGEIIRKTSVEEVFNLLKSKYNDFENLFINTIKKEFVKNVYTIFDDSLLKKSKKKKVDMYDLVDTYSRKVFEMNKNIVYNVNIALFPYKKDVYIMNCSDYLYDDIYKSYNFEDYSYWNNTDKPDEISNREWNKRLKMWNFLIPNCPKNDGLLWSPSFNSLKALPITWKYNDLKEFFDKYNVEKRKEIYDKNYEFARQYYNNKKIANKYEKIYDKMIDINENNFKECFEI